MNNANVAILTPVYNRAYIIDRLYKSLLRQTCVNFEWIIIDDGSTDNLREKVQQYQSKNDMHIIYVYQNNQGKHIAINTGMKYVHTSLTIIVDSDDYLEKDAIQIILNDYVKYRNVKNWSGISYLKKTPNNEIVGKLYPVEGNFTYIDMRLKRNITGDKAEVFVSDILRAYPFPQFGNENFLGEDTIWVEMAKNYQMTFLNKAFYVCEYLEDGLSKKGKKLRIHNPRGGMANSLILLKTDPRVCMKIKKGILYNCYSFFAKEKNRNDELIIILTRPLGWFLFRYWRIKYDK